MSDFRAVSLPRYAVLAALALGIGMAVHPLRAAAAAADASTTSNKPKGDELEEVVVTGSLIPQIRAETSQPVTVITAEDIQAKGFSSVAEALQRSSFATGHIQNPQESNQFTPGAQTLSFFGLSPSYTKYLIDGRPIADYPALYNGSDIVTSLTGIPTVLVDSVDVLPGGQSSIYGSDAIAGVVNIHLKKKMDGLEADVRYGWTKDGGGTDRRIAVADGFTAGGFSLVVGGQYEKTDAHLGLSAALVRPVLCAGILAADRGTRLAGPWIIRCSPTATCTTWKTPPGPLVQQCRQPSRWHRRLASRPGRGQYCGTFRTGYSTINNGTESTQAYLHAADDINEHIQLFTDVLLDHDVTLTNAGTPFLDTADDSSGRLQLLRRSQHSRWHRALNLAADLFA